MTIRWVTGCLVGLLGLGHAQAQDAIADFYKGKQLRIIVASSSGGGFDLYGRFVSRYLGKHIPGHPTVIVQKSHAIKANGATANAETTTVGARFTLTFPTLKPSAA